MQHILKKEVLNEVFFIMNFKGTVDNNLGSDDLAGSKALDPNNCRQPTLLLHDLYLARSPTCVR